MRTDIGYISYFVSNGLIAITTSLATCNQEITFNKRVKAIKSMLCKVNVSDDKTGNWVFLASRSVINNAGLSQAYPQGFDGSFQLENYTTGENAFQRQNISLADNVGVSFLNTLQSFPINQNMIFIEPLELESQVNKLTVSSNIVWPKTNPNFADTAALVTVNWSFLFLLEFYK